MRLLGWKLLWLVLCALPFLGTPAEAQQTFSAACAFDGGRVTFVVSGENPQTAISAPTAVLKYADRNKGQNVYVSSDIRRPAIVVVIVYDPDEATSAWVSRGTYVIDADRGSFSHIAETKSRQDGSILLAVQSGSCSVHRSQK